MRTRPTNPRHNGTSLIELAVVLILLSVFSLIAGKLFTGTFHIINDSRQAMRDIGEFDHAIRLLRADVWAAQEIKVVSPDRAEIKTSDGVHVLWMKYVTLTDDQPAGEPPIAELIRTEYSQDRSTQSHPLTAPMELGFVSDAHGLRLTTNTDTLILTGAHRLFKGVRP